MSAPSIGLGGIAGLASETTYGTYVATSRWLPITRSSLNARITDEMPSSLFNAPVAVTHNIQRERIVTGREIEGELEWQPHYDHQATGLMLRHLFGSEAATTGASAPFTHTFELGSDWPGLSVQQLDGINPDDTANVRRFVGLVPTSWELSLRPQGVASIKAKLIGKDSTPYQALSGTPTYGDTEEIVASHAGVTGLAWNSHGLAFTELTLSVDRGLVRTPYIGSATTGKPVMGGFGSVVLRGKVYRVDDGLLVDYAAKVVDDAVLTLTGTGNNALQLTMQRAELRKCEVALGGPGVLMYDVEFVCTANATKTGLKAVLVNDNSSAG